MANVWQNRIIGTGEAAPDQLLANPGNWRIHPQGQQQALAAVLDEVGYVAPVLVNQRTGHVVDGHLRVALALTKHQPTIPVAYVDLSPAEERLILATFDPLAAMAATDQAQLNELVASLQSDDEAIKALLDKLTNTPMEKVEFTVQDHPTCPTCGQKVKAHNTTNKPQGAA